MIYYLLRDACIHPVEGAEYEDFACCKIGEDKPSDICPNGQSVFVQSSSTLRGASIVGVVAGAVIFLGCVCCCCRRLVKSLARSIDNERQAQNISREANNESSDLPVASVTLNRSRIIPVTAVPVAVVSGSGMPVPEINSPQTSYPATTLEQRAPWNGSIENVTIEVPPGETNKPMDKDVDNVMKYLRQFVNRQW